MYKPLLKSNKVDSNIKLSTAMKVISSRHLKRLKYEEPRRELYPPRNNLLVRFLSAVTLDWDTLDMERAATSLGMFNLNSSKGVTLTNVFHRDPVVEVIITDSDITLDKGTPVVEVIHYPFAGIIPATPNGRPFDYPEGVAIYKLNLHPLLRLYKAYLKSLIKDNKSKDIRYFIFKEITLPLLNQIVNHSILNIYMGYINKTKVVYSEIAQFDNIIYIPYMFTFNIELKHTLRLFKTKIDTIEQLFNYFNLPTSSGIEAAQIPDLGMYPRFQWVTLYSLADKLEFLTIYNSKHPIPGFNLDLMIMKITAKRINASIRSYVSRIHNFPVKLILDKISKIKQME